MSNKSIWYISAGMLLIGYALLSVLSLAWQWTGHITFEIFRHGNMRFFFREMMNFWSWLNFGALILAGLVCFAKAFVGDTVPDLALVGLFGILALLSALGGVGDLINMIKYEYGGFMNYIIILLSLLDVAVFGGMAAIILLKSSFGSFYFLPAAIKGVQSAILFLIVIIDGHVNFGMLLVTMMTYMTLVGAMISVGRAVNEK